MSRYNFLEIPFKRRCYYGFMAFLLLERTIVAVVVAVVATTVAASAIAIAAGVARTVTTVLDFRDRRRGFSCKCRRMVRYHQRKRWQFRHCARKPANCSESYSPFGSYCSNRGIFCRRFPCGGSPLLLLLSAPSPPRQDPLSPPSQAVPHKRAKASNG